MRAGKLDRLIRIERATLTDDGRGNQTEEWLKLADLRAQHRRIHPCLRRERRNCDHLPHPLLPRREEF